MRRRKFIGLLGGAVAWPRLASAQISDRMRRVGIMVPFSASDPVFQRNFEAFTDALAKAGWVEGRTIEYVIRSVHDSGDSYDKVAAKLVALAPDVILVITETSLAAIKRQTNSTPSVFVIGVRDPVAAGYVTSISRPSGNITGITDGDTSLVPKYLQLLKQMSPGIKRVGVIYSPDDPSLTTNEIHEAEDAAKQFGMGLTSIVVHDDRDIDTSVAAFASQPGSSLMVRSTIFLGAHRRAIIEAAARYRLPAIYSLEFFATDGGLMAYSVDQREEMRQAAYLIDRILHGAKPADLPVQTPNTYRLIINRKAADALGITISPLLLTGADEVIE
jgi:ABC-type uncharacterized transport system substrate-binding protein